MNHFEQVYKYYTQSDSGIDKVEVQIDYKWVSREKIEYKISSVYLWDKHNNLIPLSTLCWEDLVELVRFVDGKDFEIEIVEHSRAEREAERVDRQIDDWKESISEVG